MNITSEEIAKLANVSRSTVSRVINHYPNVPEETRIKVMDVIKKYGISLIPLHRFLPEKQTGKLFCAFPTVMQQRKDGEAPCLLISFV